MSELKRPSIDDVAALAGVSRAAVSKVLRHAYGTSDGMRAKVQAAIAALDYRPSAAARAMRGRTFTVGVALPDIGQGAVAELLKGITERFAATRYQAVATVGMADGRSDRDLVDELVARNTDGMLLVGCALSVDLLAELAVGVPTVLVHRHQPGLGLDTVNTDRRLAAAAAVQHLAALGHTNIAYVGRASEFEDASPARRHEQGFREAMLRLGLDARTWLLEESAGLPAIVEQLGAGTTTAVIAANDELALEMMSALEQRDLGVPRDVSLVGFGNIPAAALGRVQLTSFEVSSRRVGAAAAELLLQRLEGRRAEAHDVLDPSLVIRTSTGPAPRR